MVGRRVGEDAINVRAKTYSSSFNRFGLVWNVNDSACLRAGKKISSRLSCDTILWRRAAVLRILLFFFFVVIFRARNRETGTRTVTGQMKNVRVINYAGRDLCPSRPLAKEQEKHPVLLGDGVKVAAWEMFTTNIVWFRNLLYVLFIDNLLFDQLKALCCLRVIKTEFQNDNRSITSLWLFRSYIAKYILIS